MKKPPYREVGEEERRRGGEKRNEKAPLPRSRRGVGVRA